MPVSVGDPSGLPAVNHILENARVRETLELKIEDHKLQLAPESITCTTLTHLQISAPITVDTMLAFVERLPHLFQLALHNLNLSDIQTDMLIPDADEDAIVEPLRAPLRVLTIGYVIAGYSPDTAVTLVKYMLLRIPTLAELHAAQTPNIPVLGFVEAYALRHPHLSSVKLTLN
ncbi:hypothetical protein H4R21_001229 [Coemansia helicoidea]|uniref:Uncharacterized protein n=1 Tax=Coemansia helicoidea TaxID=1286919 RepID=A0ACC1LC72_9FUNG|nr:hypothetical protein H4R21_001229 [Coemansia helicoidea]